MIIKIKWRSLFFIGLVLICLGGCTQKKQVDAMDSLGNPIKLADFHGKWVIINYWAQWCKPCLKELPDLNSLYLSRQNQVVVLGVSFDPLTDQQIQQFAKKTSIQFPMLAQFPLEKLGVNNIETLPITFIISPEGKWVKTLQGPQTQQALLQAIGLV